jgi:hypothetical protein
MFLRAVALVSFLALCPPATASADAEPRPIPFQRGITVTDWGSAGYPPKQTARRMTQLRSRNVRWVTLLVVWDSPGLSSSFVRPGRETVRLENLRQAIRSARRSGMRVLLRAYLDVQVNRFWRGFLLPRDPARWFASYRAFALRYAALARRERVDAYSFAAEMRALSKLEEPRWRALVGSVRRAFPGPVIYEANWDEVEDVPWWDAVDAIGISAYHPLCTEPTRDVSTLVGGWDKPRTSISAVQARFNRPVIFTELGYRAQLSTCRSPAALEPVGRFDAAAQSAAYEALYRTWWPVPWWKGVHWWEVRARGPLATRAGHGVSEASWRVIRRWYARPR